jgi:putative lipoprotein
LSFLARPLSVLALRLGVAVALLSTSTARASDVDPWFGRDKALHFSVSVGLAGGSYGAAAAVSDDRRWRLPAGASVALGAGVAKELYDLTGRGDASWRDLTWDVIGTAIGLGIAWLIDHLARD